MPSTLTFAIVAAYLLIELVTRGKVTRFFWNEFVRLVVLLDLACLRLLQKVIRPRYVVTGACHQRGRCCQQILADPPRAIKRSPRLMQLFISFHHAFHNFSAVARGPNNEIVFSCGHLQTDGRCGIYRYRPRICRNYPVVPWFDEPRLLPGCGYQVTRREVAAMQTRPSLRILNDTPAIHHPTSEPAGRRPGEEAYEDYELVDPTP